MRTDVSKLSWCALIVAWTIALSRAAFGGDVEAGLSARTTSTGMPVTLEIAVLNADSYERPNLPQIADVDVLELRPTESTSVRITDGHAVQRRIVTLRYQLTSQRAGTVLVPAFSLRVDGEERTVGPFSFEVRAGGPPVICEVVPDREQVYVGEAVTLRLRVSIKVFRDLRLNQTLSEGRMWNSIDLNASQWGVFESTLREMHQRDRRPQGNLQVREFDAATNETYYVYELQRTIWPRGEADLALGDIGVVVEYPVRLQADFFGSLSAEVRTVRAKAEAPDLEVLAIPEDDRPEEFRGAVGRFALTVTAEPREVAAGDPITLTIKVTDHSDSPADLSSLQAPPFQSDPRFREGFRIPDEPLAGVVSGRSKTFTQSIRPIHDQVKEVPPIALHAFDPRSDAFVVARSQAIPIKVRAAERVGMGDIVNAHASSPRPRPVPGLTEHAGGIRANVADPRLVLGTQRTISMPLLTGALAGPPVIWGCSAIWMAGRDRRRRNPAIGRRHRAMPTARRRLAIARREPPAVQAASIHAAICGYVEDRLNLGAGTLTRGECIRALTETGADGELVRRVDAVLERCEASRYGGAAGPGDLSDDAEGCLRRLTHWGARREVTSAWA
jgi:hypothetical protein